MRILYLHGFASSPASRKAQYFRRSMAANGIDLEIPDLAGGDFEGLTISGQLGRVEQAARGEPVALIGSSLGGYLAALYAARHPETGSLVLMAPAFGFARRWRERLGDAAIAEWKLRGSMAVFHYGVEREQRIGYQLLEDGSGFEEVPTMTQPTLIFHGTRDEVVPAEASMQFARLNPQTDLRLVESDHELLDVLEGVAKEALRFLGVSGGV